MNNDILLSLIKAHYSKDSKAFNTIIMNYVQSLKNNNQNKEANELIELLSTYHPLYDSYITQIYDKRPLTYVSKSIQSGIDEIIHALKTDDYPYKFLFYGNSGTGKVTAIKHIATVLNLPIYMIDSKNLVDTSIQDTVKHICKAYDEIYDLAKKSESKIIVYIRDIEKLYAYKNNTAINDILLRFFSNPIPNIFLFFTSTSKDIISIYIQEIFNLTIDFNAYSIHDLMNATEAVINTLYPHLSKPDKRLIHKILMLLGSHTTSGKITELLYDAYNNTDHNYKNSFFKELYKLVTYKSTTDLELLRKQGFSIREMELLTGISKSSIARKLKSSVD